ncbi:tetratricopeptide repeat protein, partial [candidate division KSB1 bacterium]
PIDLSMDGMWVNYSGRDRPPPLSLRELTDADLARQAVAQERLAELLASGDSTAIDAGVAASTQLDSTALARQAEQEAKEKETQLSAKYLALAEVFLFAFDKPDSALKYYQTVVEKRTDSTHVARALYSLAYVYREFKADTVLADTVLAQLIDLFPETAHAEGARKKLGLELMKDRVDSAYVLYTQAEEAFFKHNDINRAFQLWDRVAIRFPQSEYAHKSAYAKAWHCEHTLYKLDDAIVLYQALVDSFPESPYAATIKPKLAAVDKVRGEEEAKQKAVADSVARLQQAVLDSTAADSLLNAVVLDSAAQSDTSTAERDSDVILPMDAQAIDEQVDSDTTSTPVREDQIQNESSDRPDSLLQESQQSATETDETQNDRDQADESVENGKRESNARPARPVPE